MHRRTVIAGGALGLVFGSGCLGLGGESGTSGNDDDPIDAAPKTLLLTADRVGTVVDTADSREWSNEGPLGENRPRWFDGATVVREFELTPFPERALSVPTVLSGVWTTESVEAARTAYEGNPSYVDPEFTDTKSSVAVESTARALRGGPIDDRFGGDWGFALFRDANVVGAVSYRGEIGTGEKTLRTGGVDLATEMHGAWRG